ncbi:MAG: RluA family pseudouridine synthase [Candidatus Magasanikbacteria bacterium]|nr:RluA family pseudouridine synthase [Candidatus Magasanikbacteria bacterium]
MIKILYEDNHLIAVYKPAGVLVQGDKSGDKCLMDEVKEYLKDKYNKPGNVFLGLVHRLDRNVQGIVLFAKTSKGASRLSEQWREHTVEKIYHAVVVGVPPMEKDRLVHWLIKDENKNKTTVYDHQITGSQPAELFYEVIKSNKKYSLLKIKLGTGRSHQIRSQLAFIGSPIMGDVKYGNAEVLPGQAIALAATSLGFNLATGAERKIIEVSTPKEWAKYYV